METIKLFKVLVDKTWYVGEQEDPSKWIQEPEDYTGWSTDLDEMLKYYNDVKADENCESDGWEVRLCFMEVNEEAFLNQFDFDSEILNLDDEEQQECLNYFCDFDWKEIQIKMLEIR